VTLRLRTGDADAGWQLKVPDGSARTELRAPADGNGGAVPPQLREVIFGIAGGTAVRPVATLDTARTITRIVDSAGEVLVEIDDDQVSATRGQAADPSSHGRRPSRRLLGRPVRGADRRRPGATPWSGRHP
jgi:hypothetical protein